MNATALAFELDDPVTRRPFPAVARPVVEAGEDSVTGVAGIVLWGELLDRLERGDTTPQLHRARNPRSARHSPHSVCPTF